MMYQDYLRSTQWRTLSSKARERAKYECEFCGGNPDHVHHVKYPKNLSCDSIDNLVVCCASCHAKQHGIRGRNMNQFFKVEFESDEVWATTVDGRMWARFDDIDKILQCSNGKGWGIAIEKSLEKSDWDYFDMPGSKKIERFINEPGILIIAGRFGSGAKASRFVRSVANQLSTQSSMQTNSKKQIGHIDLDGTSKELSTFQSNHIGMKNLDLLISMANELKNQYSQIEKHNASIVQHEQQIETLNSRVSDQVSGLIETSAKISKIEKKMLMLIDEDFLTAADFLKHKSLKIDHKEFGKYLGNFCKKQNWKKTYEKEWISDKGVIISRFYKTPETRYEGINKWLIKFMEFCLERYLKDKKQKDMFNIYGTR